MSDIELSLHMAKDYAASADIQAVSHLSALVGRLCTSAVHGDTLPVLTIQSSRILNSIEKVEQHFSAGVVFSLGLFSNHVSVQLIELIDKIRLELDKGSPSLDHIIAHCNVHEVDHRPNANAGFTQYRIGKGYSVMKDDIAVLLKYVSKDLTYILVGGMTEKGTEALAARLSTDAAVILEHLIDEHHLRESDSFVVIYSVAVGESRRMEPLFSHKF